MIFKQDTKLLIVQSRYKILLHYIATITSKINQTLDKGLNDVGQLAELLVTRSVIQTLAIIDNLKLFQPQEHD